MTRSLSTRVQHQGGGGDVETMLESAVNSLYNFLHPQYPLLNYLHSHTIRVSLNLGIANPKSLNIQLIHRNSSRLPYDYLMCSIHCEEKCYRNRIVNDIV